MKTTEELIKDFLSCCDSKERFRLIQKYKYAFEYLENTTEEERVLYEITWKL